MTAGGHLDGARNNDKRRSRFSPRRKVKLQILFLGRLLHEPRCRPGKLRQQASRALPFDGPAALPRTLLAAFDKWRQLCLGEALDCLIQRVLLN